MNGRVSDVRKAIPLRVKLQAALMAAGFTYEEVTTPGAIHFDHDPALGLRERVGGDFLPAQLDPRFLVPRRVEEHRKKTSGAGATCAGSDVHKIAKVKRLSKEHEDFRRRMLAPDKPRKEPKRKWPSRPFRSKSQ
jgi:hypothetical protein